MPNERDFKLTKDELSQVFALNIEVQHLREQYQQKRAEYSATFKGDVLRDTVSGSSPEWPYCLHTMTIQGVPDATGSRERLRKELTESVIKLWDKAAKQEAELNRLRDYIDGVDDAEMRLILTLRYVDGLHWPEVAAKMGHAYSEEGIKKKHNRFFEKL